MGRLLTLLGNSPGPAREGLLAGYDFKGNTLDLSGNGNTGVLHNAATVTAFGLRLPNTSTHDYMTTGGLSLAAVKTVQALVYWSEAAPGQTYQVLWGNDTANQLNLVLYCTPYRQDGNPVPTPVSLVYTTDLQTQGTEPVAGFQSVAWVTGVVQDSVYVGGTAEGGYVKRIASAGLGRSGVIQIGYSALGGLSLSGTVVGLLAYSTELSDAAVAHNDRYLRGLAASRGLHPYADPTAGAARVLTTLGDSITAGLGLTTPWPAGMTLVQTYQRWNYGMSGQTAGEIASDLPRRLTVGPFAGPASKKVAVVMAGTNDLGLDSASVATVLARIQSVVTGSFTAGATGVVVVPVISRSGNQPGSGTAYDALKNSLYTLLTAGGAFPAGVRVVPSSALPHLFPDGSSANPTYFSDGLHPTQVGTDEIAAAVAPEVDALG